MVASTPVAPPDTTTTARECRRLLRLQRDTVTVRTASCSVTRCPYRASARSRPSRPDSVNSTTSRHGRFRFSTEQWVRQPISPSNRITNTRPKRQYDALKRNNATQDELDPIQGRMIRHNTARTLLFIGAIGSTSTSSGDAALNYKGPVNNVKKATTLSTICPGCRSDLQQSYWKVPIVLGGIATMGYVINFNNRGLERFKLAYDLVTDGDPNTIDEFNGRYTADYLKKLREQLPPESRSVYHHYCRALPAEHHRCPRRCPHEGVRHQRRSVDELEPTMVNMYTHAKRNRQRCGLRL